MNRRELIRNVSEKSEINQKDCEKVIDYFEEVFNAELSKKMRIPVIIILVIAVSGLICGVARHIIKSRIK